MVIWLAVPFPIAARTVSAIYRCRALSATCRVSQSLEALKRFTLTVEDWQGYGLSVVTKSPDGRRKSAAEIVQYPDVTLELVEAAVKDSLAQVCSRALPAVCFLGVW